ncbi:MAG: hypothetical protein R3175_10010 [Marinobacter sp.]|uniref:hypothetical protein n=1 Tax=Marinobacter sp. TaxID=50741 RepID=UPI00299E7F3F|nr:hypothetical protein [Marinobacter sp.]MDX1756381.1 hypothetical protein [Marinobacter sp.]
MPHRPCQDKAAPDDPGRRQLLKTGLGGALLLSGASLTAALSGCATTPAGQQPGDAAQATDGYRFRFLTADDIVLFEALLPAIIGSAMTEQPEERRLQIRATIERIDAAIVRFGPTNQAELRKLFDLLNLGLTRVTVARVWSSWPNVTTAEAEAFLERWRSSGIGLFNKGYIALTKISNVAFYGHRDHWSVSGYPGPQDWATRSLPQFHPPA